MNAIGWASLALATGTVLVAPRGCALPALTGGVLVLRKGVLSGVVGLERRPTAAPKGGRT